MDAPQWSQVVREDSAVDGHRNRYGVGAVVLALFFFIVAWVVAQRAKPPPPERATGLDRALAVEESSAVKLFTVDAFAAAPFTGNPAGVCLLDEPRPDAWMLSVAAELGYSETAFLLRDGGSLGLRWFTPTVEVDICGHATLAAAHVLFELGEKGPELVFATRSGELGARRDGDHVVIDLPARQLTQIPEPAGLREILGLTPSFVGQCEATWLAVLPDAGAVRSLLVDLAAVAELPITSLILTAEGEPGGDYDIVSRYFRPIDGIPEDPVTGSAHCLLGPYWGARLGKSDLVAFQASRRGGSLVVRMRGSRVELAGRAFTILRGELLA